MHISNYIVASLLKGESFIEKGIYITLSNGKGKSFRNWSILPLNVLIFTHFYMYFLLFLAPAGCCNPAGHSLALT